VYYRTIVNDTLDISVDIPRHKRVSTVRALSTREKELRVLNLEDYYKENESDCSELSAYSEWWLEGHGIDAYIVEGDISICPP
jgi:hypothetical protein